MSRLDPVAGDLFITGDIQSFKQNYCGLSKEQLVLKVKYYLESNVENF